MKKTIRWYVVKNGDKLVGIYTYMECVNLFLSVVNANALLTVKAIECEV